MSSDEEPGFRRIRRGRGFSYEDAKGKRLTDRQIERVKALAIPPAWRDVWICRSGNGHLQATGTDAAGRKQYLYHPRWHEQQEREKFERILEFAEQLPRIRRTSRRDLRRPEMDRRRALATVIQIMDRTSMRIGSEQYARDNGTYGLATIRSRHVTVDGDTVRFRFRGKSNVAHDVELDDGLIADAVAEMDDLPGHEVFSYVDDAGDVVDVSSTDINDYIKASIGDGFSAKDFRTWAATVAAAIALDELGPVATKTEGKRAVVSVVRTVADLMGNTPAVTRASYVDPRVIDHFNNGLTLSAISRALPKGTGRGLTVHERLVLALLRRGIERRS